VKPKVSVVMPVYNGEKHIVEAIESGLAQTYSNFELIVVNDGSSDGTYGRIQPYLARLKYVAHPVNRGVCAAANTGIQNASGDLIAFFDSDDVWFPEKLELQVEYFRANPDVALVYCDNLRFDEKGVIPKEEELPSGFRREGNIFRELFLDSLICANTVVVRRECLERFGGFDETLRTGDYDLWLRIARHHKIGYVPRVLTKYRQHDSQLSRKIRTSGPDDDPLPVTVIKKMLRLYPEIPKELGASTVKRRISSLYVQVGYHCFNQGDFPTARKHLRQAIRHWPLDLRCYGYYLATYLGADRAQLLRKLWRRLRGMREQVSAGRYLF